MPPVANHAIARRGPVAVHNNHAGTNDVGYVAEGQVEGLGREIAKLRDAGPVPPHSGYPRDPIQLFGGSRPEAGVWIRPWLSSNQDRAVGKARCGGQIPIEYCGRDMIAGGIKHDYPAIIQPDGDDRVPPYNTDVSDLTKFSWSSPEPSHLPYEAALSVKDLQRTVISDHPSAACQRPTNQERGPRIQFGRGIVPEATKVEKPRRCHTIRHEPIGEVAVLNDYGPG